MVVTHSRAASPARPAGSARRGVPSRRGYLSTAVGVVLLLLFFALPVSAQEADTLRTVEVEALNTLAKGEDMDRWNLGGIGRGELDFQSRGSRWVRSRLTLRADIAETSDGTDVRVTIPRAFVRARFPLGESYLFRATFGKSRVTWGDGALYNAGDLLFGAEGRRADLFSTAALRDETDWLVSAFFPLGQFSFVEPVVLVPESRILEGGGVEGEAASGDQLALEAPSIDGTAVGGRAQWKVANVKMETGYVYRGALEASDLSLSLQGNILVDIYGGVASTIGPGYDPYEQLRISAGALHQHRYGGGSLLSFRLEALVYPDKEWEERSEEELLAAAAGAATEEGVEGATDRYALSLFPEITWSPSESVALFGRVLVSPIDGSALWILGTDWNIYEGLTLGTYASVQSGGKLDTYGFERSGGATLTTSVRYLF